MKRNRIIAMILCFSLLLGGCRGTKTDSANAVSESEIVAESENNVVDETLVSISETEAADAIVLNTTEGNVHVFDKSSKSVPVIEDMNLYVDYLVNTAEESLAYFSADAEKLYELGPESRAAVESAGRDIKLLLEEGNLFFACTKPLGNDESMLLRTTQIGASIRGTSGVLSAITPTESRLMVFEGTVEVEISPDGNSNSGGEIVEVTSGEQLTVIQEDSGDFTIEIIEIDNREIPNFAMDRISNDTDIRPMIENAVGEKYWTTDLTALIPVYEQFLTEKKNTTMPRHVNFFYLDDDDIPEIGIMDNAATSTGVEIYWYENGTITGGESVGAFGHIEYLEKANLLVDNYAHNGNIYSWYKTWNKEGDENFPDIAGSSMNYNSDVGGFESTFYTINGNTDAKGLVEFLNDKYPSLNASLDEYDSLKIGADLKDLSYDTSSELTDSGIQTIIKQYLGTSESKQEYLGQQTQTMSSVGDTSSQRPFYGIWCESVKSRTEAEECARNWNNEGFQAEVINTDDWSNLTSGYFAITIGRYSSEEEAKEFIDNVKKRYLEAYPKYTGEFQGVSNSVMIIITSYDSITDTGNSFKLKARLYDGSENVYVVDKDTVFAQDCDMQFWSDYEKGDTPLGWYQKNYQKYKKDGYGTPLVGVFDVTLTGTHIDAFHGTYWFD